VWAEAWPVVGEMLIRVLEHGEPSYHEDLRLVLQRHGFDELARSLPALALPGAGPVGDAVVDTAVALPPAGPGQDRADGVIVLGASRYLPLDGDYRRFLDLVAGQVAAAVTDANAYAAQRRRAEELAELDRAKTEFFTGVSHELRTPLALIAGPARDGLDDAEHPLPPVQRERISHRRWNARGWSSPSSAPPASPRCWSTRTCGRRSS
jgi:K+-sensing histidine kinase KdpD